MKKYEMIVKDIRRQIEKGALKPGDKLPTEQEYQKIYGVSRITVQTALRMLREEGLLRRVAGSGTYLTETGEAARAEKNFISFVCYNSVDELMRVAEGINSAAEPLGLYTSMRITNGNPDFELEAVESAFGNGAKGVIVFPSEQDKNVGFFRDLVMKKYPIVFIDRCALRLPCNFVCSNNYIGARLATEHLIRYGHEHILYVNSGDVRPLKERIAGFTDAMADAGLEGSARILDCDKPAASRSADFGEITDGLTKAFSVGPRPTALVCGNDLIALHCMRVLRSLHYRVPDDVSVTGYDNTTLAANKNNSLTTVDQDFFLLGKTAAQALFSFIADKRQTAHIRIDPQLVVRHSTKRLF